jgi:Putative Actinobacterial Holin-X, holin superfamily III
MPLLKTNGVGWAAKEFVERARSIIRLEVELALLEVKGKLVRIAVGIGLGAGGAIVALFALGFLAAGGAAALALVLPVWGALLVVGGILLCLAGLLAMFGIRSLKAGTPPVPEEAIEEARLTTETLRANGR